MPNEMMVAVGHPQLTREHVKFHPKTKSRVSSMKRLQVEGSGMGVPCVERPGVTEHRDHLHARVRGSV
jgi:hypothetical protein